MTLWSQLIYSTVVGEALGLLHAINWVCHLQLQNVDFEVVAKIFVDYFNNGNYNIIKFDIILDECKHCCSLFFTNSRESLVEDK